ncbi:MAG: hypothetical protein ACFHWX_13110 [Bacteroidota bacterium]
MPHVIDEADGADDQESPDKQRVMKTFNEIPKQDCDNEDDAATADGDF